MSRVSVIIPKNISSLYTPYRKLKGNPENFYSGAALFKKVFRQPDNLPETE